MSAEKNKQLVRRMLDWWVTGDPSAIDATNAPDFVRHSANEVIPGRDAYKARLAEYLNTFTERQLTIDDLIAEDEKVVMRYTWEGTHSGESRGIRPTNKRVQSSTIAIFRIADGKIVEEWEEHDTLGLMQQLGLLGPRA